MLDTIKVFNIIFNISAAQYPPVTSQSTNKQRNVIHLAQKHTFKKDYQIKKILYSCLIFSSRNRRNTVYFYNVNQILKT